MISPDENDELLFNGNVPDVLRPNIVSGSSNSSTKSTMTSSSSGSDSFSNDGRESPGARHYGATKCISVSTCTTTASLAPRRRLLLGIVVSGACLLTGCLLALMVPFFPTEAMRRGVSQTTISGVFSCFSLTQLIATPIATRLIPVCGVTRVLHMGLATAAIATLVFGSLVHIHDTTSFVAACFVTRCVEAVGAASATTAVFTIVASHFDENVALMTGVLETLTACGLALAPALGGLLFAAGGYELPFYTLGALMLLLLLISLWLLRQPNISGEVGRRTAVSRSDDAQGGGGTMSITYHQVTLMASSVENWLCCAVAFSMAASWSASDAALAVYAQRTFQMGPTDLGLYLLAATGCYAVTSVLWGWLAGRTRHVYLLMSGCLLCSAIGALLMPPSPLLGLRPARWLLLFGMILQESFQAGAYLPCFPRMLLASQRAGLQRCISTQALVSGAFWTCYSMGDVVGPTLGGLLADLYGYPVMMTVFALMTFTVSLCTLVMAAAVWYQRRKRKQQRCTGKEYRKSCRSSSHTNTHNMNGNANVRRLPIV